jgi:hypothetical protein
MARDVRFAQRPGGGTFRFSPLNAVFVDHHVSWYAVHWTTPFRPGQALDLCLELGLDYETKTVVQSMKEGFSSIPLGDAQRKIFAEGEESIEFFRSNGPDYVVVWEPSNEYLRLRDEGEDATYTAIMGFGANKFDPSFGSYLLDLTATSEIREMSAEIWQALGFLADDFASSRIENRYWGN